VSEAQTINPDAEAKALPRLNAEQYARGILAADRVLLGRAITLLESTLPRDKALARAVLALCEPHAGGALRLAVTGAPGTGKSSLIERLGQYLIERDHRVAVLTTDPSSVHTGGSILGDKTRMPGLAGLDSAFIRPSPSSGMLGGVTQGTRHAITLCEAAGYDVVLVETVGVGQSETAAREVADIVLLLVLAGAGDALQAIKRGIMEVADIIAVAKADGNAVAPSRAAQRAYQRALRLYPVGPTGIRTRVLTCSAITGDGVDTVWEAAQAYKEAAEISGYYARNRARQRSAHFKDAVLKALCADFLSHPAIGTRLEALQAAVASGERSTWDAIQILLEMYRSP